MIITRRHWLLVLVAASIAHIAIFGAFHVLGKKTFNEPEASKSDSDNVFNINLENFTDSLSASNAASPQTSSTDQLDVPTIETAVSPPIKPVEVIPPPIEKKTTTPTRNPLVKTEPPEAVSETVPPQKIIKHPKETIEDMSNSTPSLDDLPIAKTYPIATPVPKPPTPQPTPLVAAKEQSKPAPSIQQTPVPSVITKNSTHKNLNNESNQDSKVSTAEANSDGSQKSSTEKGSNNKGQEQKNQQLASTGSQNTLTQYHSQLSSWLKKHKRYPRRAKKRKQEGTVKIRFTINRSGKLIDYKIIESSGHPLLDKAAENMLKKSAPMPQLPNTFTGQLLSLEIPVAFSIKP